MYTNVTNANEQIISCVPDWNLANVNYVNNPVTRQCEYCGDSWQSWSQKHGWEICEGIDQKRSFLTSTFNVTGYGTDFYTWNRCYGVSSYWETCEKSENEGIIDWVNWGYGIDDEKWTSCTSNSLWSAYCDNNWEVWYEGNYTNAFSNSARFGWTSCQDTNCGIWDSSSCSSCADGYGFDFSQSWGIEWSSQSYFLKDWVEWNETNYDNLFDNWQRCN